MPMDDLYWNSIDFGSEESLNQPPSFKAYVDPWDLENYAYIRQHLDSEEGSQDFVHEVNSDSFYYVPAREQNYAAIDEVKIDFEEHPPGAERGVLDMEVVSEAEENVYEQEGIPPFPFEKKRNSNVAENRIPRDRSLSFSYGDYPVPHEGRHQEIYSFLDEARPKDSTLPLYDDARGKNKVRKPAIFGLSNYGHLKIDYSYSWNNLDKYIYN